MEEMIKTRVLRERFVWKNTKYTVVEVLPDSPYSRIRARDSRGLVIVNEPPAFVLCSVRSEYGLVRWGVSPKPGEPVRFRAFNITCSSWDSTPFGKAAFIYDATDDALKVVGGFRKPREPRKYTYFTGSMFLLPQAVNHD